MHMESIFIAETTIRENKTFPTTLLPF